jgi:ABC-type dipeptide/oligopeptide/nickel transport system permease subunit
MSIVFQEQKEELLELGSRGGQTATQDALKRLLRNPVAVTSLAVLGLLILGAIFLPLISHYRYDKMTDQIFAPPSFHHPLGTDDTGYDILVRLAVGARISLCVGFGVEAIVVFAGCLVGLIAGFYGGWTDTLLMRLTDIMFAFPDILLAILIMAVRGPGLGNIFAALAITGWPALARLVRGQAMVLKQREFIEAARALGVPNRQIIARHIFPNLLPVVIIAATIDIAGVIIAEATLSFLGIGVQSPMQSWGSLISTPLESGYWSAHPQLVIYPAICLSLTVLAFNFLGDSLRDALDPRK